MSPYLNPTLQREAEQFTTALEEMQNPLSKFSLYKAVFRPKIVPKTGLYSSDSTKRYSLKIYE